MRRAALLLAAVLLAGCGSTVDEPPTAATVPAGLETGCPDPSTGLRFPEGDLPTGATRVRLCPGPPLLNVQGDQPVPDVQGVPELLTTDVDDIIDTVNDLEDLTADVDCTFDAGPELAYWFGYPDGDWRAVNVTDGGCRKLRVGVDTERLGGIEVATAFVAALTSQRSTSVPPDVRGAPTCGGPFGTSSLSPLPGRPVQLSSAVLCRSAGPYRGRQADVPPALLARINADLLAGSSERPSRCGRVDWRSVEGFSVWGDRMTYVIDHCGAVRAPDGEGLFPAGVESDPTYVDPDLVAAIDRQGYGPAADVRRQ